MRPPAAPPLKRILKAWAPEASVVVIGSAPPVEAHGPDGE